MSGLPCDGRPPARDACAAAHLLTRMGPGGAARDAGRAVSVPSPRCSLGLAGDPGVRRPGADGARRGPRLLLRRQPDGRHRRRPRRGPSWRASPRRALGWDVEVDAWGGTGYTTTRQLPRLPRAAAAPRRAVRRRTTSCCSRAAPTTRGAGRPPRRCTPPSARSSREVRRRQPQAQIVLMGAYDPPPPGRSTRAAASSTTRSRRSPTSWACRSSARCPAAGRSGSRAGFLHPDRLHPNARGYGVMGARLAEELAGARPRRPQLPGAPGRQQRPVDQRRAEDLGVGASSSLP